MNVFQRVETALWLLGEILTGLSVLALHDLRRNLLPRESPCKVMAASDLIALPAPERSQGLLGCALGLSVLVKVLSRQINAPLACFVYHNEDCSVGREASLLPTQKFHKRGALRFLVVGKPQNVGWSEGTVQVILQKSCLTLGYTWVAWKSDFTWRLLSTIFRYVITTRNDSGLSNHYPTWYLKMVWRKRRSWVLFPEKHAKNRWEMWVVWAGCSHSDTGGAMQALYLPPLCPPMAVSLPLTYSKHWLHVPE